MDFPKDLDFVTHGFDVKEEDGVLYFFMINHRQQGSVIEKFALRSDGESTKKLEHIRTFDGNSAGLNNPNDIQIVSAKDNTFYATNDHYYREGHLRFLETFGRLPWSNLYYHSGDSFHIVADKLQGGNGVTGKDGKLYVSIILGGTINVYSTHQNGSVTLDQKITLDFLLDNPCKFSK